MRDGRDASRSVKQADGRPWTSDGVSSIDCMSGLAQWSRAAKIRSQRGKRGKWSTGFCDIPANHLRFGDKRDVPFLLLS